MVRPKTKSSLYDTIYLWRPKNCAYVKVGVTSSDIGLSRIEAVASKMNVDFEVIILSTVKVKATILESKIKGMGIPVTFSKPTDGHTEFRWMGPEELSKAVQIIADNSWLN